MTTETFLGKNFHEKNNELEKLNCNTTACGMLGCRCLRYQILQNIRYGRYK